MTIKLALAAPLTFHLALVGACADDATTGGGGVAGGGASGVAGGGAGVGGALATGGATGGGGSGSSGAPAASGSGGAGGAAASGGSAGVGGGAGAGGTTLFGQLACAYGTEGDGVKQTTNAVPPEWTVKPDVTPGHVTDSVSYTSTTYDGYKFPYRVYTSANYVQGQPALFLVFGDGGTYLGGAYKTPVVLDNLTAEGALLPTVALFVDPGDDRVNVYDPPTDKYARFLTEELIPKAILPMYTVSKDPDAWATIGYSASGEAGFAVVWHRPEQFHNFFGHSASFGASIRYDGWVWADKLSASPKRELRVSLAVAAMNDLTDDRGSWRTINENVASALQAKGNSYRLVIGPGDHGGLASQQDFPNALRWMWRGCQFAK